MRLLAQQELVDGGDILFRGDSLKKSDIKLSLYLAFISEEQILPSKKALRFWVDFYQRTEPQYDRQLVEKLMKEFSIDPQINFFSLSRGQKMKALFCLEAGKRPQVYLLDEITAVLDSGSRWSLIDFLGQEVARGCLVIMSTNIANELQSFATQVVVLEGGEVELDCEAKNLEQYFQKWLVKKEKEPILKSHPEFRRIGFGGENWICLGRRGEYSEESASNFERDQREITLADVQTFFTSGEGRP